MDPVAPSENPPLEKSETVKIESSDSNSFIDTNRSLTGCDTKLVAHNNGDSDLRTKEPHEPNEGEEEKSDSSDDSTEERKKSDCDEDASSITVIEKSAREAWLDKIGIRGNTAPKFPHYSELKDRLKSYSSWTSQNQQPSVLSEAGFFYIGVQDRTACFHCGGGLREWKSTDDPWVEHAHWFPKCNFILNVKGKEFIDQAWRCKLNTTAPKEMKNAADALKDLFDVMCPKLKSNFHEEKISLPKYTTAKSNVVASGNTDSSITCRICYEEERSVLFLPCNHAVSCGKCASQLSRCVICRATIDQMVRAIYA